MNESNLLIALVHRFVTVSVILIMAISSAVADENVAPQLVHVSTPVYRANFSEFTPRQGTYLYRVSWQGIPAAEASVTVKEDGITYRIKVAAKTYSGIDWIYRLRYFAEGVISSADFLPVSTIIDQRENSRHKQYIITFSDGGGIKIVKNQKGKDQEVLEFTTKNFTLDPFSAAFLARGLDWEVGETKEFDTFNGKSRYLIKLTAVEKTTLELNGVDREVWVISPQVQNLTNPENSKKLRNADIYVTADRYREIVQIVSSVFIGNVKTKLLSFTPAPGLPGEMQLAQHQEVFFK